MSSRADVRAGRYASRTVHRDNKPPHATKSNDSSMLWQTSACIAWLALLVLTLGLTIPLWITPTAKIESSSPSSYFFSMHILCDTSITDDTTPIYRVHIRTNNATVEHMFSVAATVSPASAECNLVAENVNVSLNNSDCFKISVTRNDDRPRLTSHTRNCDLMNSSVKYAVNQSKMKALAPDSVNLTIDNTIHRMVETVWEHTPTNIVASQPFVFFEIATNKSVKLVFKV